jgi:hypothetical protein
MVTIVIDEEIERIEPTPERLIRGDVKRAAKQIQDIHGDIGDPWRTIAVIESMCEKGKIDEKQLEAGERFGSEFSRASLVGIRASDMTRPYVDGVRKISGGPNPKLRDAVWGAIIYLGGQTSPHGSCAWEVLGFDKNLNEWRLTYSATQGRAISHYTAEKVLREMLKKLVVWYGI